MSFKVTVEPSGRSFDVPADQTILQAGIANNIPLPYGCQDGACGSCKCKKISGEVTLSTYQENALSAQELADGFILTCRAQPHSDIVLESRQVGSGDAFPVKKLPARVFSIEERAPDVKKIVLQLPAAAPFAYHAGQYIEVILRDNSRRSYSMANAPHTVAIAAEGDTPAANRVELHIRHMPGGKFTDHVFGAMKEKEILRAEGPFGSFYLRECDKPIIMLASGTGFAPIKALLEHLQFTGSTRPVAVYWGGRRPRDLYMHDWLLAQAAQMPNVRYVPVVSDALPEDNWLGRSGFVHMAVSHDFPDLSQHQVYACGAPIVVDSARALYTSHCGLPADEFYADSFTSEADKAQA